MKHASSGQAMSKQDPRIGTDFGGYTILALLGEGTMGKVYRANGGEGADVALKIVKDAYVRDQTFRRRFSREARVAETVKHQNVVPVFATGEQDGIPFMAQRFIAGSSLDAKLKREGRLGVAESVRICRDVAAGLDALWSIGLVHRDIKPANILLDERNNCYISDFGLAKDTQGSVLTRPGQTLGSMDYMAPEQIRGEEVAAVSDVYSLGCVMYECVCGRPPFAEARGVRVLWAHLRDEPPHPVSLRRDLDSGFAQALLLALRKQRDERPESAGDYARVLQEAAGS